MSETPAPPQPDQPSNLGGLLSPEQIVAALNQNRSRGEYSGAPLPPAEYPALFRQGRLGILESSWKERVSFLDVFKKQDRERWMFLNMNTFNSGIIPGAEVQWKGILDKWLSDLKDAYTLYRRDQTKEGLPIESTEREVNESRKDLIAMMAISSSARAMEQSGGSSDKYIAIITQNQEGDLDRQDSWQEYLLHKDPEKYYRAINHPLVQHYYKQILEDAGITHTYVDSNGQTKRFFDTGEKGSKTQRIKILEDQLASNPRIHPSDGPLLTELRTLRRDMSELKEKKVDVSNFVPDRAAAKSGKLFEYLADIQGQGYKGGFDSYVNEVLLERDSDAIIKKWEEKGFSFDERRAAAKIATDAFMVDKLTRWEYSITRSYDLGHVETLNDEPDGPGYMFLPFRGWGGDPLRSLLEPSFLPRRIKRAYARKEDQAVLIMADRVFRPQEIFTGALQDQELKASMVVHLKNYARLNKAMQLFYGSSRAGGIPMLDEKTLGQALPEMVELLDQVYGDTTIKKYNETTREIENRFPVGKHIVGKMIAMAIDTKAYAAAAETHKPGFKEVLRTAATSTKQKPEPLKAAAQYIWGPFYDAKDGLLLKIASARTRIAITDRNIFGAQQDLNRAYKILISNDQKGGNWWSTSGAAYLNTVFAYAEAFARFNP